ncbi:MAG: tryptophan synthase subunit beta, partial [Actinobacteria bacterium]|nr:tryptophan synthase subunit beta [Actinomycetota bacterium]
MALQSSDQARDRSLSSYPDASGHFGVYGGRFVPEALTAALDELDQAHSAAMGDPVFQTELADLF